MRRRRISLAATVAVCLAALAVAAVGIAGAAGRGAEGTKVERPELTVQGRFSPRELSRRGQTPIRLDVRGAVRQRGAFQAHPVAVREIQVESADLEVHTKGIPTCRAGQLQATETKVAASECGAALIGAGTATAQVAFAEQQPIDVSAPALVFNGGKVDGKTTLYVHMYFSNPISGAIVAEVTVEHLPGGRFGTLAVANIPQITGGSGSIVRFHLTIDRKARGRNPISATCADGEVRAYVEGKFEDGTRAATEVVRPCRS